MAHGQGGPPCAPGPRHRRVSPPCAADKSCGRWRQIPFDLKRVFYTYDVPTGESRGAHAHKQLQQVIICLSGSFDVLIDDGEQRREVRLHRPWRGLYIPRMIWARIINFDPGSVCLVLASELYSEEDYYREYGDYLKAKAAAAGEP